MTLRKEEYLDSKQLRSKETGIGGLNNVHETDTAARTRGWEVKRKWNKNEEQEKEVEETEKHLISKENQRETETQYREREDKEEREEKDKHKAKKNISRWFQCGKCSKTFDYLAQCDRHNEQIHNGTSRRSKSRSRSRNRSSSRSRSRGRSRSISRRRSRKRSASTDSIKKGATERYTSSTTWDRYIPKKQKKKEEEEVEDVPYDDKNHFSNEKRKRNSIEKEETFDKKPSRIKLWEEEQYYDSTRRVQYHCVVCDVYSMSWISIKQHYDGRKHAMNKLLLEREEKGSSTVQSLGIKIIIFFFACECRGHYHLSTTIFVVSLATYLVYVD